MSQTAARLGIRERVHVQMRLGQQPLQLAVLGLELTQTLGVGYFHATELRAPLVEGRVAETALAAHLINRQPRLGLLEEADDLLLAVLAGSPAHHSPDKRTAQPLRWYGREGAGQGRPGLPASST